MVVICNNLPMQVLPHFQRIVPLDAAPKTHFTLTLSLSVKVAELEPPGQC